MSTSTNKHTDSLFEVIDGVSETETTDPEKPDQNSEDPENNMSLEDSISNLNKMHAGVMIGGKFCILNEVEDPETKRPDITLSSVQDFRNRYANRKISNPNPGQGQLKEISIAKAWLESPKRRQYKGIVFSPGGDIQGYYNLFRGFDVEPKEGDWKLFWSHIFEVIAAGDSEITNWILAWMARIVQAPGGVRPGTTIVLRGSQGVGKGIFVSTFGKIFGSHFLHLANEKHLTGRFNSHLKDALLVFCDEAIWAGDKAAEGVLKSMVTEDRIVVEPKGKDVYNVKNHINLIIASNNDWVVPAGLEERRFLVLDVSDKYIQDKKHFKAIVDQMANGGTEAMLYDLLNIDISIIDLRTIPRTPALLDQIERSMDSVEKFWFERLRDGTPTRQIDLWLPEINKNLFYNEYIEFCKDINIKHRASRETFGKKLIKLCPEISSIRPTIDGIRVRQWVFPSLDKCRDIFEKRVNIAVNWEEEYVADEEDPECLDDLSTEQGGFQQREFEY